eukprot:TRINITY_DN1226_c0_g1_i1.p1 TRINITY_DN1226_c0_g1~~TRINITY_DN1226_c0_g1_i1.p1  ORF type:complete len:188 (-),score=41.41 TRINITY_DN1226_c0_g1_i1:55-618(-)
MRIAPLFPFILLSIAILLTVISIATPVWVHSDYSNGNFLDVGLHRTKYCLDVGGCGDISLRTDTRFVRYNNERTDIVAEMNVKRYRDAGITGLVFIVPSLVLLLVAAVYNGMRTFGANPPQLIKWTAIAASITGFIGWILWLIVHPRDDNMLFGYAYGLYLAIVSSGLAAIAGLVSVFVDRESPLAP